MAEENGYEELDLDKVEEEAAALSESTEEGQKVLQSGAGQVEKIAEGDVEVVVDDFLEDAQGEPKEEAKEEAKEDPQKKPRKSRAQTRIRNLSNEKKQLQAQLEQERRTRFEMENRLKQQTYSSAKGQRKMLEGQLQDLAYKQERALQEGNYRAHALLSQNVADTNLKMRVLDYETQKPPQRRQYQPPAPQQVEVPEVAHEWADNNTWFMQPKTQDDAIKRQAALVLSTAMINEGMDPTAPDFYQELDQRLDSRFSNSHQGGTQETQRTQTEDRPVVGGVGRQAPVRRSGKNTVRITREEKDLADSLGISPQEYVRQKKAQQDATESGSGWTEIL